MGLEDEQDRLLSDSFIPVRISKGPILYIDYK